MASPSIGIVCVHYDTIKLAQTLRCLNRIERDLPALHRVFVANHETAYLALQESTTVHGKRATVLRHDNSGMEFGASQAGLDRLLAEHDPEWVLFANDTFATHHSFGAVYRRKLVSELSRRRAHAAVVGRVDALPRSFEVDGLRIHRWVTTNLFALNREALRALANLVYSPRLNELVAETSQMADFFAPRVDPVLRVHLEAWLFRAHSGPQWYAASPLTAANAEKMARKARSILQEKYLSAVLENASAEFLNLDELSVCDKVLRAAERGTFSLIGRDP